MLHVCQTHQRPSLADDKPIRTTDPTGTGPLRKRLNRELDKRWQAAARLMREAVDTSNILGVGAGPTLATVSLSTTGSGGVPEHHHPPLPGSDKIEGFHQFATRVLQAVVLSGNAAWISPYLAEAGRLAAERSGRLGVRSSPVTLAAGPSLAASELGAVVAHTATAATRAVAHQMGRARPQAAAIARDVGKAMKAGAGKSKLAADYLVSKAFIHATVAQFRAAGIGKVGIEPERYAKRVRGGTKLMARDEAPVDEDADTVEVVTAGDDLVCAYCDEITGDGPYTLDEAQDLIPAHPNCRCSILPAEGGLFGDPLGLLAGLGKAALGLGGGAVAEVPEVPGLGLGIAPEVGEGLAGLEPAEEETDSEEALEAAAEEEHGLSGVGKAAMGAALGLGAGALVAALLPGEKEEPEPAPEEAEEAEEPEDDFPEIFSGTTAEEYVAYVNRWIEWADANDWPSDLIQDKWNEESAIRRALQVPLTPQQANDLLQKMEAAGAD